MDGRSDRETRPWWVYIPAVVALGFGGGAIVLLLQAMFPPTPSYTTVGTVIRQEDDRVIISYKDRDGSTREESFPLAEQSHALQVGEQIKVHDAYRYKLSHETYLDGQRWDLRDLKSVPWMVLASITALVVYLALRKFVKTKNQSVASCHRPEQGGSSDRAAATDRASD